MTGRAGIALLAVLFLFLGIAVPAGAEEAAPGAGAAAAEGDQALMDRLNAFGPFVIRLALMGVGIWLLIREFIRVDRMRVGILPAPEPVEPTVVIDAVRAIGLVLLLYFGVGLLAEGIAAGRKELRESLEFQLALSAAVGLPMAGFVILRRARLQARGRRPAEAVGAGIKSFFLAQALVLPAVLVSAFLLVLVGVKPTLQDLVRDVMQPGEAWRPWAIAFFGIVVAPVTEESLFRGLLYPALRQAAGGRRRGAWIAAIVVSLLFAAVHAHLLSFLPLFALAMVLAWTMETTNSLLACIVTHAAHNAAAFVAIVVA